MQISRMDVLWKNEFKETGEITGRGLAIVYRDTSLNCCDLSKKSGQLSLRMNLLRLQAIEMFKCVNEINSEYMNDMFTLSESHYEFRNKNRLLQPKFDTYKYGYRSFRYFGSNIWIMLPYYVKYAKDLHTLKTTLYKWCQSEHAIHMLEIIDF